MNTEESEKAWKAYEEVWAEMRIAVEVSRRLAVVAGEAKLAQMRVNLRVDLAWKAWELASEQELVLEQARSE